MVGPPRYHRDAGRDDRHASRETSRTSPPSRWPSRHTSRKAVTKDRHAAIIGGRTMADETGLITWLQGLQGGAATAVGALIGSVVGLGHWSRALSSTPNSIGKETTVCCALKRVGW